MPKRSESPTLGPLAEVGGADHLDARGDRERDRRHPAGTRRAARRPPPSRSPTSSVALRSNAFSSVDAWTIVRQDGQRHHRDEHAQHQRAEAVPEQLEPGVEHLPDGQRSELRRIRRRGQGRSPPTSQDGGGSLVPPGGPPESSRSKMLTGRSGRSAPAARLRAAAADRPGRRALAAIEVAARWSCSASGAAAGLPRAADRSPGALGELVLAEVAAVGGDGGRVASRLALRRSAPAPRPRRRTARAPTSRAP